MKYKLNNNTRINEPKSWLFEKTKLTNPNTNLLNEREDKKIRDEKWDMVTDNNDIWRSFKKIKKTMIQ